ncbi:hypothetical protein B0H13DRAFT_2267324 [Mycena leptocephala]|nr:hypothetical protein B0H13DRAFT_2267324 [Mycena leptocephala]
MYEEIRERCVDLGVDPAVCDALITILSSPTSTMSSSCGSLLKLRCPHRPRHRDGSSICLPPGSGDQAAPDQGVAALADRVQSLKIVPPPPPPHLTLALREEEEESSPSLPPPVGEEHELSK